MKKNITINMQGRLYAIDEDAYNLLKQYEDSLRNYFSAKEGGHEIVDDIEARIAELFDEVVATGKAAIDISDVQHIISRIGNPRQMDDAAETEDNASNSDADNTARSTDYEAPKDQSIFARIKRCVFKPGRRLYRDTDNKSISGVLAGLAHYYGGEATWWRAGALALSLLFIFGGAPQVSFCIVLAYFILGITVPPTRNAEDRLRMNGREVNPQNLGEEVTANSTNKPKQSDSLLSDLGKLLAFCAKMIIWFVAILFGLGCLTLLIMLSLLLFVPSMAMFSQNGLAFPWVEHPWLGGFGMTSLILFIVLIVFFLVTNKRTNSQSGGGMSTAARTVLVLLTIASLAGIIACGTAIISDICHQLERFNRQSEEEWYKQHTHNGLIIDDIDWNYLTANGWTLKQADNCNDSYTRRSEYYTGDTQRRYLESINHSGQPVFCMEHTDSCLAQGKYTLTAIVRADGTGAYVYAIANGKTYLTEIPADGNTGGNVWQDAQKATKGINDPTQATGSARRLIQITEANDGKGFGWNRVTISGIQLKDGPISYGVTTVPEMTKTQFCGTYVSATDFSLLEQ